MICTKRAFFFGLTSILVAQRPAAAKPTIFDFYDYVRRLKAASDQPHEEPWISARVRAVDRVRRQIRVMHLPASAFKMPAMTMTLLTADTVDLAVPKIGEWIEMRIAKRKDRIEIVDLRSLRRCGGAVCPP